MIGPVDEDILLIFQSSMNADRLQEYIFCGEAEIQNGRFRCDFTAPDELIDGEVTLVAFLARPERIQKIPYDSDGKKRITKRTPGFRLAGTIGPLKVVGPPD